MKSRELPILPILLMIAIGAGVYGLYKTMEFEQETYYEAQSAEARKNPFLAASRFLEKHGFETMMAENRGVLTQLNIKETGVLLLDNLLELEDPREVESILNWINSGGILLTSPGDESAFEDTNVASTLLEQLGVASLEEYDLSEDQKAEHSVDSNVFYVWLNDKDIEDKLLLGTKHGPYFINNFMGEDGSGNNSLDTIVDSTILVYKSMGEGYFSVYSDPALFYNIQLELLDHAYALLWLTQSAKTKSMMLVYRPTGKPGLFKFVWNKFTVSILVAMMVLAGFLRWASTRLGPIEQELPPINNNLMAHLEARGEYWYRHKHTPEIVTNVQQSTLEQLARQRGKLGTKHAMTAEQEDADRAELIKHASKILKCSASQAEKVLFAKTSGDANILKTSQALQKINHQKLFNQQNLTE